MTSYLADINVWIAIAFGGHPHNAAARAWYEGLQTDQVWFCRFTQLGFLRLLTNRAVMGGKPMTQEGAWSMYDEFREDERVAYIEEPAGVEEQLRAFTSKREPATKGWGDAYLAALALQAGLTVATFDRGLASVGAPALLLA
jgi:toxin-antitoxin system PIN domain toxin